MAHPQIEELRQTSVEELRLAIREAQASLFQLRCEQKEAGRLEKPHLFKETRKKIARLHTLVSEKEREQQGKTNE